VKPGPTPGSWILESAELAPAAGSSSPVGTAGSAAKSTFILNTKPGDDLKAHANHKIDVTGTVAPASASSATASSATSTATATTATKQTFNVDSFKMVSASCP
jgi:hypothetical protein